MDFITVKEASMLWHMDVSRIGKLLKEGRIAGAEKTGGHWLIPRNAAKPVDRRTRRAHTDTENDFFRFPLLINKEENRFFPPLSDEEILLRRAQVDFFACDFEKASEELEHLTDGAKSIYIRICALFFKCVLAVGYKNGEGLRELMYKLDLELVPDFPHKREMKLLMPLLYAYMGLFMAVSEYLTVEQDYDYHPTVYPLLSYLTIFRGIQGSPAISNPDTYVVICKQLEHDGHYYEAQELNMSLFCIFSSQGNEKAALYHLRRGLSIATEHDLIVVAACYESYFPKAYRTVLDEYPNDFSEKVLRCSAQIHESYAHFTSACHITDMITLLSKDEHQYILYIVQGFKYKEIADLMNISERTVAAHCSRIFDKLGVNNKQELIRLYYNAATAKGEF